MPLKNFWSDGSYFPVVYYLLLSNPESKFDTLAHETILLSQILHHLGTPGAGYKEMGSMHWFWFIILIIIEYYPPTGNLRLDFYIAEQT